MRLIDADALKDWSEIVPITGDGGIDINDFDDQLEHMPTIDAVPIIRCKDCKFLRLTGNVWRCQNRLVMMLCEPNDYCSRAERK